MDKSAAETIKRLEQEIFALKSVINHLPGSIYWKNTEGAYLGRNLYSTEKMHQDGIQPGLGQDDVIGKTDYDYFDKETADRYRKTDLECMRTRQEISREEPMLLPNNEKIIQLSTKRPMYNEEGEVIGVIGNTVDITHLKEIEEELRRAKNDAELANKTKTEFMKNMEHDLRTPFSGILGMSEILALEETNPYKKEIINDIESSAKCLYEYCNEILKFSHTHSGEVPVLQKKFSPNELVEKVILTNTPACRCKNLPILFEPDPMMPKVVVGDRHRIYTILLNLLGNSIKFTDKGSITLRTKFIDLDSRPPLLRFEIEDTGIGIPEVKQDFIYEKFSRLSLSNEGHYLGIGNGLSTVKQFMNEMSGEIDLISKPGHGTKFICTIPVKMPLTEDFVPSYKD